MEKHRYIGKTKEEAIEKATIDLQETENNLIINELTEERVLKNLKEMTDKTVIIVTHRKAALNVCNKIITLHNGKFIKAKEK